MTPTINYQFSHGYMKHLALELPEAFFEFYEAGSDDLQNLIEQHWRLAAKYISPEKYNKNVDFEKFEVKFKIGINNPYDIVNAEHKGQGLIVEKTLQDLNLIIIEIEQVEPLQITDCKTICIAIDESRKEVLGYFTYEYGREDGQLGFCVCEWNAERHLNYEFIHDSANDKTNFTGYQFLYLISNYIINRI